MLAVTPQTWFERYPYKFFLFGKAECPGGCRNGGFCNERRVCECPDGFYGPHCEKGKEQSASFPCLLPNEMDVT